MGWGTGNIGGGSGGGLNFKVVGNPQPSYPKENTIWVNTDVKITSYIFSATEPEAPVEGKVWIATGTSSTTEFNALKKNGIQVYPISAKQYVSGAWVDVTAQSYQGGAWKDWITWYFKQGKGSLVGDWSTATQPGNGGGNWVEITDDSMAFICGNIAYNNLMAQSPLVDLTNINTLHFEGEFYNYTSLGVSETEYTSASDEPSYAASVACTSGTEQSVDVQNLSGEYYITIFTNCPNGANTKYVYNVWGE